MLSSLREGGQLGGCDIISGFPRGWLHPISYVTTHSSEKGVKLVCNLSWVTDDLSIYFNFFYWSLILFPCGEFPQNVPSFLWIFNILLNVRLVVKFFAKFNSFVENVSVCAVLLPVKWYIICKSHFMPFKF